jgi:hypothetical protein
MALDKEGIRLGLGVFLALLGALCFYSAVFWETAKTALSSEAQEAIGNFAQSRNDRFHGIGRLENTLNQAKVAVGREKELADKWRFVSILRSMGKECRFHADVSRTAAGTAPFWEELLHTGGWIGGVGGAQASLQLPAGITIRIPSDNSQCAGTLQRALADVYPNPPSKISINQQTAFLSSCAGPSGQDCVQIDINY